MFDLIKRIFLIAGLICVVQGFAVCYGQDASCRATAIWPGAYNMNAYLHKLKNKRIAVVANHTSLVFQKHLIDTLLDQKINVVKIFVPEHGFRGNHADGVDIKNSRDAKTGIPVVSLYGDIKKPTPKQLQNIDIVIFDIQDVGARFYTYISTLTYVMEACAENKKLLFVFDRPNPNGFYVDGPVLQQEFTSFVGMHNVPVVYGMSIGEYAQMVNGEKWLNKGVKCKLTVIKCRNYTHTSRYQLPVNPSPNLQNMHAIYLYPSLCLFEGTVVSIGRGTDKPFRVAGHPLFAKGNYSFTPQPIAGVSDNPPLKGKLCLGYDLTADAKDIEQNGGIRLNYLIDFYNELGKKTDFFTAYFPKLAGGNNLQQQIVKGLSEVEIRASWQADIAAFKKIRKKYLLYPDFE